MENFSWDDINAAMSSNGAGQTQDEEPQEPQAQPEERAQPQEQASAPAAPTNFWANLNDALANHEEHRFGVNMDAITDEAIMRRTEERRKRDAQKRLERLSRPVEGLPDEERYKALQERGRRIAAYHQVQREQRGERMPEPEPEKGIWDEANEALRMMQDDRRRTESALQAVRGLQEGVRPEGDASRVDLTARLNDLDEEHITRDENGNATSIYGRKIRTFLYPGEEKVFRERPDVAGMAAEDGTIILNPYSNIPKENYMFVAKDEAVRHYLNEIGDAAPVFELTPKQKEFFSTVQNGKPYSPNKRDIMNTILARIITGDTSAMDFTPEQDAAAREVIAAMRASHKPVRSRWFTWEMGDGNAETLPEGETNEWGGNLRNEGRKPLFRRDESGKINGYSTTSSTIVQDDDGSYVVIPTVVHGRELSPKDAERHYRETDMYWGKTDNLEDAQKMAEAVHAKGMKLNQKQWNDYIQSHWDRMSDEIRNDPGLAEEQKHYGMLGYNPDNPQDVKPTGQMAREAEARDKAAMNDELERMRINDPKGYAEIEREVAAEEMKRRRDALPGIVKAPLYAVDLWDSAVGGLAGGAVTIAEGAGNIVGGIGGIGRMFGSDSVGRAGYGVREWAKGAREAIEEGVPTDLYDTSGGGVVNSLLETGKNIAHVSGEFAPAMIPLVGQAYAGALIGAGATNAAADTYEVARATGLSKGQSARLALLKGELDGLVNMLLMGKFKGVWGRTAKGASDGTFMLKEANKYVNELFKRNGLQKLLDAGKAVGRKAMRELPEVEKVGGLMGASGVANQMIDETATGQFSEPESIVKTGIAGFVEGGLFHLMNKAARNITSKIAKEIKFNGLAQSLNGEFARKLLRDWQARAMIYGNNQPEAIQAIISARQAGMDVTPEMLRKVGIPRQVAPSVRDCNAIADVFASDYRAWNEWVEEAYPSKERERQVGLAREIRSGLEMDAAAKEKERAANEGGMLSADEAREQQRQLNDARERNNAEQTARELRKSGVSITTNKEQLAREEAYPRRKEGARQEGQNETGNGADEAPAPARPEQGAREPQGGEAEKPVEGATPRGEAPREGVVEPQSAENRAEAPAEGAGAQGGAKATTTTPKTAEGVEAAPEASGAKPSVEVPAKANDAQKMAYARIGGMQGVTITSAKMGKDGKVRMKYTRQATDGGQPTEYDCTIGKDGLTSTSVAGGKPAKATPTPAVQTGEVTSPETPASAAAPTTQPQPNKPNTKTSPNPAPKTNRLRRRDGTDPIAEREAAKDGRKETPPATEPPAAKTEQKAETPPAPVASEGKHVPMTPRAKRNRIAEVQKILANRPKDLPLTPETFMAHASDETYASGRKKTVGLDLQKLRELHNDKTWHNDLGLAPEEAQRVRDAVDRAFEYAYLGDKRGGKYEAVATALRFLDAKPDDLTAIARARTELATALDRAERNKDELGRELISKHLAKVNEKINAMPPEQQAKIPSLDKLNNKAIDRRTRKNEVSATNSEGKDVEIQASGRGAPDEVEAGEAAGQQTPSGYEDRNPGLPKGARGQGGSLGGNRHLIIDSVNGDNLTVTMKDAAGKVLVKGQKMTRAQWAALANGADAVDGDPAAPKKGDLIRRSKSDAADLPDAWTPESRKPLERVAQTLRNVVTVGGKKVKVLFADRPEDVDGQTRKSIGGIFTGTAADYANRSRQGGVDDGELRYMRNGDGDVVGEYDAVKGEIRLYPGAKVADVVHEFTHPLVDFARAEAKAGRPELLNKIKEIIDAERKTWEQPVRDAYKGKGEGEILEEIFTHAMGARGADLFGKSTKTLQGRRWYNRLWEAIKGVWRDFATKMGWNRADLRGIEKMSPEDAAQRILSEMAKGRSFGNVETGGEGVRNANIVPAPPPPAVPGGKPIPRGPTIDVDQKETKGDVVQRKIQDFRAPLKKLEEQAGIADKSQSVYHALDLNYGKNRDQAQRLTKTVVEPMMKRLYDTDLTWQKQFDASGGRKIGLDDYVYAVHALERNPFVSSGMDDAKARAILDVYDSLPLRQRTAIHKSAQDLFKLNKATLVRRVQSGRLSVEEANRMLARYQHYVPLRTDMEQWGDDLFNTGTGGWSKHEFHKALGRTTEADSPTVFSLMQANDAITGANKNEARLKLWDIVAAHPELGRIRRMDKLTKKWSYTDGREEWVADERYNERDRDDLVMVKRNGQLYAIQFNGEFGRRIAAAVTGRNLAKFPDEGVFSYVPRVTRLMAEMRTQLVPTFILRNIKADHLDVLLNSMGDFGPTGAAKFLGSVEKNFVSRDTHRAIDQYFNTGRVDTTTEAGRLFDEFTRTGSLIGGGNRMGYADTATELSDFIHDLQRGKSNPARMAKSVKSAISVLNEHVETGTRFSVYATLRKMGWTPEEAATYCRDLTTNFNRKGEWTPVTNSLFMFSNAAIQGMARAYKSGWPGAAKFGGRALATVATIGALGALWNHFVGSDDERKKSGEGDPAFATEYDKANRIVVGAGGYGANLRVRYPWAAVQYASNKLAEYVLGDCSFKDLAKGVGENVAVAMLQEPFGHGGTGAQTLSPSLLVPFTQVAEGKDFRGEDLYAKKFDENTPDSENGKRSTGEGYKAVARAMNRATGGDEFESGLVDVSPETVKLVVDTLGGGVWTDIARLGTVVEKSIKSAKNHRNEFELRDVPFLGDLVHHHRGPESRYYEAIDEYGQARKKYQKTKDMKARAALGREKPYVRDAMPGKSYVDILKEHIDELTHQMHDEIKVGRKWVQRKTPLSDEKKDELRKRRAKLMATVLRKLGKVKVNDGK